MPKLLVVDDDPRLLELLAEYLGGRGFDVVAAPDGEKGLDVLRMGGIDLVVLDVMLPGKDGFEVCREIRRAGVRTPIILLTAKSQEAEKVMGLELGADDYVTKPFSPRELMLRVQAILRRGHDDSPTRRRSFGDGELVIDEERREVIVRGQMVDLTPTEWGVLATLASVPGRVYSRSELINRVRGYEFEGYERTIDSHVKNLRRKVEYEAGEPAIVATVLGAGYRLALRRDG